jgi:hypothetical protein
MITRIKEIHWWDPKSKSDAVTWKVWVEQNGQTALHYFDSQTALDEFVASQERTQKVAKKPQKRPLHKNNSK